MCGWSVLSGGEHDSAVHHFSADKVACGQNALDSSYIPPGKRSVGTGAYFCVFWRFCLLGALPLFLPVAGGGLRARLERVLYLSEV